jgi:DNA-binding transcriptional regulator YhcF (GntR family)
MSFLRFLLLPLLIRGGVLSSTRVLGEMLFVRGMTLKLAYTRVVRVCIVTSHDGWYLHRNFNLAAERSMVAEERTTQYVASL